MVQKKARAKKTSTAKNKKVPKMKASGNKKKSAMSTALMMGDLGNSTHYVGP